METSILLAKVLGIFFLIGAIYMLSRRDEVQRIFRKAPDNIGVLRVGGMIEILLGLFLTFGHSTLGDWRVVFTIIGVLSVLEGVFYLFFSQKKIRAVYKWFLNPAVYYISSVIALAFGVYLTYIGFTL